MKNNLESLNEKQQKTGGIKLKENFCPLSGKKLFILFKGGYGEMEDSKFVVALKRRKISL